MSWLLWEDWKCEYEKRKYRRVDYASTENIGKHKYEFAKGVTNATMENTSRIVVITTALHKGSEPKIQDC